MASTSSSTVRATIVELDHCGTQARVRARSGAESEAGGTASGASGAVGGRGAPRRRGRGDRRAHLHGTGSVGARNPARACSTVDLPDPLGPTSAVRRARRGDEGVGQHGGPAGAGGAVDAAGWCARRRTERPPGTWSRRLDTAEPRRSTVESPRQAVPGHRGATSAGSTAIGVGRPRPRHPDAHGEQPVALGREGLAHRPVGDHPPSADSTTSRSTRSTHGPSTCSTTTSVGEGWPWRSAGSAPTTGHPRRRSARRRRRAPPAPRPGRASPSARRAAPPTGRAPGSRRAPAAGSARRTAPTSGCRAAGHRARPSRSAEATTPAMAARGIRTFSGPNATSRPTEAATTPAPGSCSTSPTAPGRSPGRARRRPSPRR